MMRNPSRPPALSIVAMAHAFLRNFLRKGDWAVDLTCGNGHDTVFLAEMVGEEGRVMAVDLQAGAIESSKRLAEGRGVAGRVAFHQGCHSQMAALAPVDFRGRVRAIMMNLGWLPGGDKSIVTRPSTSSAALDAAADFLAPGGVISVAAYRGHEGGEAEWGAVQEWIDRRGWRAGLYQAWNQPKAPVWVAVEKPLSP